MNTCQTSMKTGILLLYLHPHHGEGKRHHSGSQRKKLNGGKVRRTNGPPNTYHDDTTETIIASYWSAQFTNLSAFRSQIPSASSILKFGHSENVTLDRFLFSLLNIIQTSNCQSIYSIKNYLVGIHIATLFSKFHLYS